MGDRGVAGARLPVGDRNTAGETACFLPVAWAERREAGLVLRVDSFDKTCTAGMSPTARSSTGAGEETFCRFCRHAVCDGFADHLMPLAASSDRLGRVVRR